MAARQRRVLSACVVRPVSRKRFQEAVERARAHGIDTQQYVRHEAVDGCATEQGFALSLRSLDTDHEFTVDGIDRVLLSTGHWQSKATDPLSGEGGYLTSPYPPDAVNSAVAERVRSRRARGERPRVFVQGMGPSGIDAIMTLCGDGEFTYTDDGHIASYQPATRAGEEPLHIVAGSRSGFFSPVRGRSHRTSRAISRRSASRRSGANTKGI